MKINPITTALSTLLLAISSQALGAVKTFNYDNILIESLRLNDVTDFKDLAEDWLFYSDRETYRKYKSDEFEFQEKVDEAGKKLQKLVQKEEKSPVTFNILVDTQFGEYDFENHKFDYQPLMNGHLYVSGNTSYAKKLPRQINLYVSNPEIINGIPMEKAEAKQFIQKRKNQFGSIDRSATLSIHIRFDSAEGLDSLTGEVLSYEIKDKQKKVIYQQKAGK